MTGKAWSSDACRRLVDLVVATTALLLTSPIVLVAAGLVLLEDGGPVLYRRRVLGRGGYEFDAYKIRTMAADAATFFDRNPELASQYQANLKLVSDPRVTRVGRTLRRYSIDEIPQLLNIIRGDMTLVGPRMLHPPELDRFGDLRDRMIAVKPGLTGLWQVKGRQSLTFDDRLRLDREYLESRSLLLDLSILLQTPGAVISGRGAH